MDSLDMNMLVALDALLETSSVTRAAERLHTSPPAMSRTLTRLRRTLGDPLLVRAGRDLVPTPRALELRGEVAALVLQARTLLTPRAAPDPGALGHPLTAAPVTPESFAAADHIGVSRRGRLRGPVDERLGELGLARRVVATVPGYATALLACRGTDLVCLAPGVPDAKVLPALGLRAFALPFALPAVGLAMAWHPRQSADGGHRWLRSLVREAVTTVLQPRAPSS